MQRHFESWKSFQNMTSKWHPGHIFLCWFQELFLGCDSGMAKKLSTQVEHNYKYRLNTKAEFPLDLKLKYFTQYHINY